MAFSATVAKDTLNAKGRLYKSFKLKSQKLQTRSNLLSDRSLFKICELSSQSLKELVIRSSHYLSNTGILNSVLMLRKLKYLDFGYSASITDSVIIGIADSDIA